MTRKLTEVKRKPSDSPSIFFGFRAADGTNGVFRQSMKLCEKTTDFRVNLCCFSTVSISGLQPHAQLRSIYILRLCMRLFCPHTFLMPHVYRHNRERPTSIYSSKYRCSAVIIIVLYVSITLSGGIPRSTAQKRINKKASPRSRYPYSG